ncbi:MAG: HAD family hydrolase [Ruminococcaceae bacterium]|nr:HAD family hydrolase [Oscillospiraceae bacterium]
MEIRNTATPKTAVKAVLFDFDGTISTLRCGWEKVMGPLFEEILDDGKCDKTLLRQKIEEYIDESTGIQTILQMKWLKEQVEKSGRQALDIWDYKKMYNDRLMLDIKKKLSDLEIGKACADDYLMRGSVEFLKALKDRGVKIFVASGTDDPDVHNEAKALGVDIYFDEIKGAPLHEESCSKEAVIKRLLESAGYSNDELAVCGDGKVEIALGKEKGARAIGLASFEKERGGIDEAKRKRLINADADIICGDFLEKDELLAFLGF